MTVPYSISFQVMTCHTSRPGLIRPPHGILGTTKQWVVVGITIPLTILIPVVVLWARWKLGAPRRGGKWSISVQLEKNEARKSTSTATSSLSSNLKSRSKSAAVAKSGSESQAQAPSGGRSALDRFQGRKQGDTADTAGKDLSVLTKVDAWLVPVQVAFGL